MRLRQRARHVPRLAAPLAAPAGGSEARVDSETSGRGPATGTTRDGRPALPSPCAPRRAPLQLRRWAARRWARRRRWATRVRRRPRRPRPGARRSPSAARPHRPSHARHPATLTPGGCADSQVAYQSPLRSLSVDLQHDEQQPYSSPIRQLQLVSPAAPSRARVAARGADRPRRRYPGCARRQAEGGAALPPAESRGPRLSSHLRLPRSRMATAIAPPPALAPPPSRAPPPPLA